MYCDTQKRISTKNIAGIITSLRKEKGWSETELTKESNISREILGKYERGEAVPSIDFAKRIADALGVSLDYLVGEGQNAAFDKKICNALKQLNSYPKTKNKPFSPY